MRKFRQIPFALYICLYGSMGALRGRTFMHNTLLSISFPRYSAKHIPSVRSFVCCLSREGHVFTSIVYQCSSDLCRKLILSLCQFRTWPRFHANFCATIMKISQSNIPQQQHKEVRLWVAKSLSVCFKREYEKTVPTF